MPFTFDLGDRAAVVYYTEYGGVCELVTTVGPSAADGDKIVCHVARPEAGEGYTVAIAGTRVHAVLSIEIERPAFQINVAMRIDASCVAAAQ